MSKSQAKEHTSPILTPLQVQELVNRVMNWLWEEEKKRQKEGRRRREEPGLSPEARGSIYRFGLN